MADGQAEGTAEDGAEGTSGDQQEGRFALDDEFMDFLREYSVIGLAIGVVMGTATKDLVNAAVDGIIMPVVDVFLAGESWESAVTVIGPVTLRTGRVISAALDFVIIAFIVFAVAKYILGREKVEKI